MVEANTETTKNIRTMEGVVVKAAMDKTVVVLVDRYIKHSKYRKYQKQSKHYKAHDEENAYEIGDRVRIEECRPISREKKFRVVGRIEK